MLTFVFFFWSESHIIFKLAWPMKGNTVIPLLIFLRAQQLRPRRKRKTMWQTTENYHRVILNYKGCQYNCNGLLFLFFSPNISPNIYKLDIMPILYWSLSNKCDIISFLFKKNKIASNFYLNFINIIEQ